MMLMTTFQIGLQLPMVNSFISRTDPDKTETTLININDWLTAKKLIKHAQNLLFNIHFTQQEYSKLHEQY